MLSKSQIKDTEEVHYDYCMNPAMFITLKNTRQFTRGSSGNYFIFVFTFLYIYFIHANLN